MATRSFSSLSSSSLSSSAVLRAELAARKLAAQQAQPRSKGQAKPRRKCAEVLREAREARYNHNPSRGRGSADWLDLVLLQAFRPGGKGTQLDVAGFLHCCRENGLDTSGKWANSQKDGWQGRLRMNGRLKLEAVVLQRGYLLLNGERVSAPQEWKHSPDVLRRNGR